MPNSTSKDSKASAPFTMPKFQFQESYEPVAKAGGPGRQAEPNPFEPVVKRLAETFSKELGRSKAAITVEYKESDRVRIKAKIAKAANALGYSPTYDAKASKAGGKVLVMSVYLVPKIERKRKAAETATVPAVTETESK